MENRIIHILWTGGLDSTFRVVELSRRNCVIQPHYLLTGRKNIKHELKAISKITSILKKDKRTLANILPLETFSKNNLEEFSDISLAWELLKDKKNFKSGQYHLLARYARQKQLKMEMGLQFSENGTVVKVLDETVLMDCPGNDEVRMIDPEKGSREWASLTIFKDFLFPKSLYHKTKIEEIEELKNQGYSEVLKNVWTCFSPVFGMPCGHCFACRSAKKEGAGMMIPFLGNLLGGMQLHSKKVLRRLLPQSIYELLSKIYHKII